MAKIITPVVTIFNNDEKIDYEGNAKVIDFLIENGVDGILPLGSTGEFPALSFEERKEFLKFYVEKVNGRVDVIAGTGCENYEKTLELTKLAHSFGVKGCLIIPPYYYGISQEEAFRYYDKLASEVDGDIYIYNFKERSGFDMSADTVLKLVQKHTNIIGMKDSTDNIAHTKDVIYKVLSVRPNFEVYSGFDDHFIPNVMAGGAGCIAALSNFRPALWADWVKAFNDKEFLKLKELTPKFDKMMPLYSYESNFPMLFKQIMKTEGLDINCTTLFPFNQVSDGKLDQAIELLKTL